VAGILVSSGCIEGLVHARGKSSLVLGAGHIFESGLNIWVGICWMLDMVAVADAVDRLLLRLSQLAGSKQVQTALYILLTLITVAVGSGAVYNLTSGVSIGVAVVGGVIRVFYPDMRAQTYAELFVTATYYFLGFLGLLLYGLAVQRRTSPRSARVMFIFSTLLIIFSAMGIILGFMSKTR